MTTATAPVVPGTAACWRLKDAGRFPPYTAVCACGWDFPNRPSHRMSRRVWQAHVRAVRRSYQETS